MSGYYFRGAFTEICNSINSIYEQVPSNEYIANVVNSVMEQMPTTDSVQNALDSFLMVEGVDNVNENNDKLFTEKTQITQKVEITNAAEVEGNIQNTSVIGGMLDYFFTQESPNNADFLNETVLNQEQSIITKNIVYNILDDIKNSPSIVADMGSAITTSMNEILSNPLTTVLAAVGMTPSEHEKFNTDTFIAMLDNFLENHKDSKNYDEIRFYLGLLLTKYFNLERDGKNKEIDKELLAKMDIEFSKDKLNNFFDRYKSGQKEETKNGISIFIDGLFASKKHSKAEPLDHEIVKKYIDDKLTLTFKQYVLMKSRAAYNSIVEFFKYLDRCFENALKKPIHMYVDSKFSGTKARKTTEYAIKTGVEKKYGETAANIAVDILKATGLNESKTVQEFAKNKVHEHVDKKVKINPSKILKRVAKKGRAKASRAITKTKNNANALKGMIKKTMKFSDHKKITKEEVRNNVKNKGSKLPTLGRKRDI